MTEGFLSRWSRRKAGKENENAVDQQLGLEKTASQAADISSVAPKDPNTQTPLPLTLEDVEKIDRFAPDFSAFMKPDVDPAVQQAALKKMFTDPHFNVMDGLDIYIDDYSNQSDEGKVTDISGTQITVDDSLGFTPSSSDVVDGIGFPDHTSFYRFT